MAWRHPVSPIQQCGGLDCRPVRIEITYGLEAPRMYLQDVEEYLVS